jgi:hypothetical protein
VGCFDTEDEALDFVDNHYEICEVQEEFIWAYIMFFINPIRNQG